MSGLPPSRHTVPPARPRGALRLLLLARQTVLVAVTMLLVTAGVWASWEPARHAMAAGSGTRGLMTVLECDRRQCTGPYTPSATGSRPRDRVVLRQSVDTDKGREVRVALRPGTDEVVRTGAAGLFRSALPLGGALLLAAVVVAGGLRMSRTAWTTGIAGLALLVAACASL